MRHDPRMTGFVEVRPASEVDAEGIASIYAGVVLGSVASFEEVPPDVVEMRRRMLAAPRLPWLVAARGGQVVAYAYASRHRPRAAYRWSVECSVYVGDGHRRLGIGRALYERLLAEVAGLGYVSLLAGITLPNPPSVALHEAVGFEHLGVFRSVGFKFGAWHDVGWWRRELISPVPVAPAEPRAWQPT